MIQGPSRSQIHQNSVPRPCLRVLRRAHARPPLRRGAACAAESVGREIVCRSVVFCTWAAANYLPTTGEPHARRGLTPSVEEALPGGLTAGPAPPGRRLRRAAGPLFVSRSQAVVNKRLFAGVAKSAALSPLLFDSVKVCRREKINSSGKFVAATF